MGNVAKLGLVGLLVVACATGALATEGGGGAYPNGAEGFMTGALPPPGDYIIDYSLFYWADKMMDADGDEIEAADFELMVIGNVLRYVHVTPVQIFGASWAQHIFVPVLYMDVEAMTPGGLMQDDKLGIGDIIVDPFILGWHSEACHLTVGLDIYVPVGSYDENDMANIGRNYWTFEPVVAVTCLKNGWEASAKFMYDINLENDDTKVTSGHEFHFDYTLAMHTEDWAAGIGGFYYKQITEDDGNDVEDSEGQSFGIGPQVMLKNGPMSFVLKYQYETLAENKPEGHRGWFKFIWAL